MIKIFSNLAIGRICLICFILLGSVFTIENAFSRRKWENSDLKVTYDQKDKSIYLDFLFYEHTYKSGHFQHLSKCEFFYREKGGYKMIPFMTISSRVGILASWIKIEKKVQDDNILFSIHNNHPKAIEWLKATQYDIEQIKTNIPGGNVARMTIKWDLSKSSKHVDMIHILGFWKIMEEKQYEVICLDYPVTMVK